eukprot:TRINITY_DN1248_c0_g5_i3.p4 TRINITY_DN1248_c0_g5~~TRINITY_DN1248_c0_g5_i3.p4  ORF type:complete len:132 (+),score=18.26 TRINITY_DN1248_c0_g5_i3:1017-1412(+)
MCIQAKLCPNISIVLCDDIYVKIKKSGKVLCRFSFNTAFIEANNKLKFRRQRVDPDSVRVNKAFSDNFEIIMYFSDICDKCTNQTPVEEYCQNCIKFSRKSCENWTKISSIMDVGLVFECRSRWSQNLVTE